LSGGLAVAIELPKSGFPLNEALINAGRRRFRPILMTSLCTIFGLAPSAAGFGPGAQMQQPLAIAVIGGLIANMRITGNRRAKWAHLGG
jgi:HAE1 family hydrophobic/amphiphilic exporter-1